MERTSHAQQVPLHFGPNTGKVRTKHCTKIKNELPTCFLSKTGIFRDFYIRVLMHFRVRNNSVNYIIYFFGFQLFRAPKD